MGSGAYPQKAFHSQAMWRHQLFRCVQSKAFSHRLTSIHSISLRFTQICLVSSEFYRFTHSHPDSHKLFQIHADFCSPTQNRTLSFRFTQNNLDSPHPLQILSISFRFTQSRLDPLQSTMSQSDSLSPTRFTSPHSDWRSFVSSQFQITRRLSQIHSFSLRFTQTYSDFPRCVQSDVRAH